MCAARASITTPATTTRAFGSSRNDERDGGQHARPPVQKAAILPEDLRDMLATLPHDLRGLRDRAILETLYATGIRVTEASVP